MNPAGGTTHAQYELRCTRPTDETLLVRLAGSWKIQAGVLRITEVQQHLDATPRVQRLAFDTQDLTAWDSGLLTFLRQVMEQSRQRQIVIDQSGLPAGVQHLLALAAAVPEREGARRSGARLSWLASIGTQVLAGWKGAWNIVDFTGAAVIACGRFLVGKARFRRVDLALFLQLFGGGKFFQEKAPFVIFFDSSVQGLNVGAPVVFRGVQVGQVAKVEALYDPKKTTIHVKVIVELVPGSVRVAEGVKRVKRGSPQEALELLV